MGPKAEAAARFAEATGALAAIASLEEAAAAVTGHAGTVVHMPDANPFCGSAVRRTRSRPLG